MVWFPGDGARLLSLSSQAGAKSLPRLPEREDISL